MKQIFEKIKKESVYLKHAFAQASFFKKYEHYEAILLSGDKIQIEKMLSHPALDPRKKELRSSMMERIVNELLYKGLGQSLPPYFLDKIWKSNKDVYRMGQVIIYFFNCFESNPDPNQSIMVNDASLLIYPSNSDKSGTLDWIFKTVSPEELIKFWLISVSKFNLDKQKEFKVLSCLDDWMSTHLDSQQLALFSSKFELLQQLFVMPIMEKSKASLLKKQLQSHLSENSNSNTSSFHPQKRI